MHLLFLRLPLPGGLFCFAGLADFLFAGCLVYAHSDIVDTALNTRTPRNSADVSIEMSPALCCPIHIRTLRLIDIIIKNSKGHHCYSQLYFINVFSQSAMLHPSMDKHSSCESSHNNLHQDMEPASQGSSNCGYHPCGS